MNKKFVRWMMIKDTMSQKSEWTKFRQAHKGQGYSMKELSQMYQQRGVSRSAAVPQLPAASLSLISTYLGDDHLDKQKALLPITKQAPIWETRTRADGKTVETRMNGMLHSRNGEPAVRDDNGKMEWYTYGQLYKKVRKGVHVWYKDGGRHRDGDEPAVIHPDGTRHWYKDGKLHRDDDQPAVIVGDGRQEWYKHGFRHRDGDEPAVIFADGTRQWYKDGKIHRDGDEPAVIEDNDGARLWYKNGELHRDGDAPAVIDHDGKQEWYKDSKLHRDGDEPAMIYADGTREWYKDGKIHRDGDEPALIRLNGTREWYRDGTRYK